MCKFFLSVTLSPTPQHLPRRFQAFLHQNFGQITSIQRGDGSFGRRLDVSNDEKPLVPKTESVPIRTFRYNLTASDILSAAVPLSPPRSDIWKFRKRVILFPQYISAFSSVHICNEFGTSESLLCFLERLGFRSVAWRGMGYSSADFM